MEVATSFKAAINRTFSDKGVFWEKINDQQLRCVIMGMMREFQANDSNKQVIGSLLIGRQPNLRRVDDFGNFLGPEADDGELKEDFDNAVYIMNENVQVILSPLYSFSTAVVGLHVRFFMIDQIGLLAMGYTLFADEQEWGNTQRKLDPSMDGSILASYVLC